MTTMSHQRRALEPVPPNVSDVDICNVLLREMARVDDLRLRFDLRNPNNVWPEFWMRRALLRAKHGLHQRNMTEIQRMLKVLVQIHGAR